MIAIPAVDVRDAACVQLVGGSYADERIRLSDPPRVARRWYDLGFRRLHVVDLDAATGRGENGAIVDSILRERRGDVQVGGGLRSSERVEHFIDSGARHVVLGTRAVRDPQWLSEMACRHPDQIIVAADVHERQLVTHGWDRRLENDVVGFVAELDNLPLAGLLVTAVHVEGQMQGPDLSLVDVLVQHTTLPVLASGGVGSIDDLRALQACGAAGAVIGMALYTGALDARAVAEEFFE